MAAVSLLAGPAYPASAEEHTPSESASDAPTASSSDAEWSAWAQALDEEAHSTDWAADSAARGCELVSIDIRYTTVPESDGAPAGLTIPIVERSEDCMPATQLESAQNPTTADLAALASACASTSGPGTICLSRSGSYVTSSFTYRGSGSRTGFIRIYQRSSSSGCGTGSTIATGSSSSYTNGQTRSVSAYAGYGHYSASFWRQTTIGHTNWGTVCDTL
ncbi:hypothetical protein [Ruania halotolerans]|uniref:hypothetical protein n=1 Tax=Ruania halotolerans TaxID=2897773 RepID=UPI001E39C2BF|nr:hypothetical protein [Ruania halotolerans]UFU05263.1 hypothetical protein LQF10_12405 [Ruania halotolerans]